MKRREALKGIGLSLGYAIATPAVVSLLQSCKTDANLWTPEFFTVDEGIVVKNLIDLILPKTENTLGALDVNVPEFLDKFSFHVLNNEDQERFKVGLVSISKALTDSEKKLKKVPTEKYISLLNKYLRATKEEQQEFSANENEIDVILFKTLNHIRDSAVWAFKTSEQIGENVLAYDPIPSAYFCGDLKELTNGKSWSLS